MHAQYCIQLNKTVLIFFPDCPSVSVRLAADKTTDSKDALYLNPDLPPGSDNHHPNVNTSIPRTMITAGTETARETGTDRYVVQVTIKQAHKDIIRELSTFFIAQHDITKAIESVLHAHILVTLPPEILITGNGYVLKGTRKHWSFGMPLRLRWGDLDVRPCEDKWTFVFETVPTVEL